MCFFKRMAGRVVWQKLDKALVHSGDVTLNIRFFKVGRGDCIHVMFFLGGHVAQAAMRLATGSMARVRSQVSEGWRFSSVLRIQTAPGVHSAYYKMSTAGEGGRA